MEKKQKKPKLYDILRGFNGSNDGKTQEYFTAGSQVELCESLAEVTVRKGWAREVKPCAS